MNNFGDRLKQLRNKHNLTQQDIAKILNVGRATIAGYETKGKQPDYEKLTKLATYFHVSTDYLLGINNNKGNETDNVNPSPKKRKTIFDEIDDLNPESLKDLEKYIHLLKLKEEMDKGSDETSSALEKKA